MSKNKNKIDLVNIIAFIILILCIYLGNLNPGMAMIAIASIIPMVIISINANRIFSLTTLIIASSFSFLIYGEKVFLATTLVYLLPAYITGVFALNETVRDGNNRPVKILIKMENIIKESKKLVKVKTTLVPKSIKSGLYSGENVYKLASLKVFLASLILFTLGMIAYFLSVKYVMNIDLIAKVQDSIKSVLDTSMTYMQANNNDVFDIERIETLLENIGMILIFAVFVEALFLAIIAYFISLPILNKFCEKKIFYVSIDNIILPGKPVMVLLLSVLFLYILGDINPNIDTKNIVNSYILVMNILFFLEGVSLLIFIVKRWGLIKKNINWLIMVGLIIFMGVMPGISALGMLDSVMNYRLRWLPKMEDDGGKYED